MDRWICRERSRSRECQKGPEGHLWYCEWTRWSCETWRTSGGRVVKRWVTSSGRTHHKQFPEAASHNLPKVLAWKHSTTTHRRHKVCTRLFAGLFRLSLFFPSVFFWPILLSHNHPTTTLPDRDVIWFRKWAFGHYLYSTIPCALMYMGRHAASSSTYCATSIMVTSSMGRPRRVRA